MQETPGDNRSSTVRKNRIDASPHATPNAKLNTVATFPELRAVLTHNEQYGAYRYFPEVEETILKIQNVLKSSKTIKKIL